MRYGKIEILMTLAYAVFVSTCLWADEMSIAMLEFEKYYEQACGRKPLPGSVRFSVNPTLSKSGNDAYHIVSDGDCVKIVGSNGRSCLYGVYDLLERRVGCRWFWDGDRVPHTNRIDLSGLNVREESRFEFRGIRYFAHRGLTRFQAEHWGLEDWKKEIDWCVKARLNLMMLRIGQDDLFQKAFSDIVDYPDPSKPLPEAMGGYDNRSLFWSLQYRGNLRKRLQAYAFARGLMIPEDFGTMSHWYSRTPYQFLKKMKPALYPQQGGCYGHETDRVWDIRDPRWLNAYWKLTETSIANYGKPDLLHTIGLGERQCYTNRDDNFAMKVKAIDVTSKLALSHYPNSRILLAGWDFWNSWYPEEIRNLLPKLNRDRMIIWDYEADASREWSPTCGKGNDFTQWGVVGNFPYTFGIFEAFESALDPRADYALIEERQRTVDADPCCRGYIFWPESSHTDIFMLRFFTSNAWKPGGKTFDSLIGPFCRDRYGKDAERMEKLWRVIQPMSRQLGWGGNCGRDFLHGYGDVVTFDDEATVKGDGQKFKKREKLANEFPFALAARCFGELAELYVTDPYVRRDAVDLARMLMDRRLLAGRCRLLLLWRKWQNDEVSSADLLAAANAYARDGKLFAGILAAHEDYSLYESYVRLGQIEKIANPEFEHILADNAFNNYCRSHQFEAAAYWYAPIIQEFAREISRKVRQNDHTSYNAVSLTKKSEALYAALLKRPLLEMAPQADRSAEAWRKLMGQAETGF